MGLEGTKRYTEAPGLPQRPNGDSQGAWKGTQRNTVGPEMYTGAPRIQQKAHGGVRYIPKCPWTAEGAGQGELKENNHPAPLGRGCAGLPVAQGSLPKHGEQLLSGHALLGWRLLPPAARQRELGIASGASGKRRKSGSQEQSILSLVHRGMFATALCRHLEKGMDHSLPGAKAWSLCPSGSCPCGVSSRSGILCAGYDKRL